MFTYCPGCAAIFRISTETVGAAGGRVRCGECDRVFNVVECLFDNAVEARHAALLHAGQSLPLAGGGDGPDTDEFEPESGAAETAAEAFESDADTAAAGFESDAETEFNGPLLRPLPQAGWNARGVRRRDVAGGVVAGLLVLLLGAQWGYFNLDALARDNTLRPSLERVCGVLHCRLPLRVDLSRLEIIDRDVRKHPQAQAALLINATIANRAAFPQPYPVFEVSFSDVGGNLVAMRRFLPAEYLGKGDDAAAGMATDVPVHIVLELQDPGDNAVSFQFGFL